MRISLDKETHESCITMVRESWENGDGNVFVGHTSFGYISSELIRRLKEYESSEKCRKLVKRAISLQADNKENFLLFLIEELSFNYSWLCNAVRNRERAENALSDLVKEEKR